MRSAHRSALLFWVWCACQPVPTFTSVADESSETSLGELKLPSALDSSEFDLRLDRSSIRALQTWVDDATFDAKWASMLQSPIDFFGATDSSFHHDLASLPKKRLPGGEALCHGDPKFDNFGWTLVDGAALFAPNDFDDSGYCPVAAEALRYLVATSLWFDDAALDEVALSAYVDTVDSKKNAVLADSSTAPSWPELRAKALAKSTAGDALVLGGEVQQATAAEVGAITALVAADSRFGARLVLDVARDVHLDGGSAGLRRWWVLTSDAQGTRTILELKELGPPGTEFGRHSTTLDGDDRFDVLKAWWWHRSAPSDHFEVTLWGARFLVRDRLLRATPSPGKLTAAQVKNLVAAQASVLALAHRDAWGDVKKKALRGWLHDSAATLTARWRKAASKAGGH